MCFRLQASTIHDGPPIKRWSKLFPFHLRRHCLPPSANHHLLPYFCLHLIILLLILCCYHSACISMQISRRFLKYLPRNTTFVLNSLSARSPDAVSPKTPPLIRRAFSNTNRPSSPTDMATLLWGYLRVPFIVASSLGFVLSSGLFYFQKSVYLLDKVASYILTSPSELIYPRNIPVNARTEVPRPSQFGLSAD